MMMQPKTTPTPRPAGLASVVRSIAGAPGGWRKRRGSFLVLVVGTLALLAVVMLVYVSVGNQDVRNKAALAKHDRQEDVPRQIAAYLANQVIGADRIATQYEDKALTNNSNADLPAGLATLEPSLMRETTDFPFTSWSSVSSYGADDGLRYDRIFTPIGTYLRPRNYMQVAPDALELIPPVAGAGYPSADLPTRWEASDPFLADTEPRSLSWNGLDQINGTGANKYKFKPAAIEHSWRHISNVAPDGRFVNLYNLAPVVGGKRIANFDARNGYGTDPGPGGSNLPRLSEDLALLVPVDPNDPTSLNFTSGNTTVFGANVTVNAPPHSVPLRDYPAAWDSLQLGMFRPVKEWRTGDDYTPGGKYYFPYQVADADGDGNGDSRWQELTDSRVDPLSPLNFLKTDGKYRYFIATRIIDASALINVNTAGDQAAAPTRTNPVGLTPADIDMLRLLTMQDSYERLAFFGGSYPTNPLAFGRPTAGYDGIRNPRQDRTDELPDFRGTQDLGPTATTTSTWPADLDVGYNVRRAFSTGFFGYTAARFTLAGGMNMPQQEPALPSLEYRGRSMALFFSTSMFGSGYQSANVNNLVVPNDLMARRRWDFVPTGWYDSVLFPTSGDLAQYFPTPSPVGQWALPFGPISLGGGANDRHFPGAPGSGYNPSIPFGNFYPDFAERRAEYYQRVSQIAGDLEASFGSFTPGTNDRTTMYRTRTAFGIDDLAELVTFRACNDPSVISNLERVIDGRDDTTASATPPGVAGPERFGALRSGRGFKYEFLRDDRGANIGSPPDGLLDPEAQQLFETSVRQRLTTVSGATPLRPVRDADFDQLTTRELKIDAPEQIGLAIGDQTTGREKNSAAVNRLFQGYCDALLPHSGLLATSADAPMWNTSTANFHNFKTLFYGYKGPEFALYTAAHMAVNLTDMADEDTVPSAFTLLANESNRVGLNTRSSLAYNDPNNQFPFWGDSAGSGNRLDLNYNEADPTKPFNRLARGGSAATLVAPAANIYGVEAQPFLTAVSVFTVYADMTKDKGPLNAGDTNPVNPQLVGTNGDDDIGPGREATLRRDVSRRNADLMYRVLAFRITNPFTKSIKLGNRGSEYAGAAPPANLTLWDVGDDAFPRVDREADFFYITFGGRHFKLSALRERVKPGETYQNVLSQNDGGLDTTLEDITIGPGKSIVCYAISQAPRVVYAHRLHEADGSLFNAASGTLVGDKVRQLIARQLKQGNWTNDGEVEDKDVYWIPEFDGDPASPTAGRVGVRVDDGAPMTPPFSGPLTGVAGDFVPWGADRFAFSPLVLRYGDRSTGSPPSATDVMPPENTVATLWRAVRVGDTTLPPNNTVGRKEYSLVNGQVVPSNGWDSASQTTLSGQVLLVPNDESNDLMVDRLRIPFAPSATENKAVNLDVRLYTDGSGREQQLAISGAQTGGGDWDTDTPTIGVWAGVRRPIDPSMKYDPANPTALKSVPEGAMPLFCIERKDPGNYDPANTLLPPWNRFERAVLPGGTFSDLNDTMFTGGFIGAKRTINEWVDEMAGTGSGLNRRKLCLSMMYGPDEVLPFATVAPLPPPAVPAIVTDREGTLLFDFDTQFYDYSAHRLTFDKVYAEAITSDGRFEARIQDSLGPPAVFHRQSTLRVGDLLLPMGVGPTQVPRNSLASDSAATRNTDVQISWTTFGESLCYALGYDLGRNLGHIPTSSNAPARVPAGVKDAAALLLPQDLGPTPDSTDPPAFRDWRLMFDRGNLRLDEFSPFYDANGAPTTFVEYKGPESPAPTGSDYREWTQVPLALNVFDIFSAAVAGKESLTRAVPGLININTAPLAVMRCLPMVSPPADYFSSKTYFISISPTAPDFTITVPVLAGRTNTTSTTVRMKRGAPPSLVQLQLEALPGVGRGNVSVMEGWRSGTGPNGLVADYAISFIGQLSGIDFPGNVTTNAPDPSRSFPAIPGTFAPNANAQPGIASWLRGIEPAILGGVGSPQLDGTSDIAATIVAYRDKLATPLRPTAWHVNLKASVATSPNSAPIANVVAFDDFAGASRVPPNVTQLLNGRQIQGRGLLETHTRPVNEQPGLLTLGALQTIKNYQIDPTTPNDFDYKASAFRNNIDYMGYPSEAPFVPALAGRSQNNSRVGVDSVLYGDTIPRNGAIGTLTAPPATPDYEKYNPYRTDAMENEFKEQLAVTNALANITSTRSDYYICWFVLHGYQKSDLENLGPTDPIVPSIARRFVMVVDRSNVVKRGDVPRVLLFKEVAYKAN